jgi:hypothetical protein
MPTLISSIDAYFAWVKQQLLTLNASVVINGASVAQPIGGVVPARDWPQTPIDEGALYLVVLDDNPVGGTKSQRGYAQYLQWCWMLIGQDIQAGQVSANRGDRYRQAMQIEENLRQANYPGFCQKQDLSCDSQGNLTFIPSISTVPPSGYEPLYWSELTFKGHTDSQASGLIYGAAAVELYSWSDVNPLVA